MKKSIIVMVFAFMVLLQACGNKADVPAETVMPTETETTVPTTVPEETTETVDPEKELLDVLVGTWVNPTGDVKLVLTDEKSGSLTQPTQPFMNFDFQMNGASAQVSYPFIATITPVEYAGGIYLDMPPYYKLFRQETVTEQIERVELTGENFLDYFDQHTVVYTELDAFKEVSDLRMGTCFMLKEEFRNRYVPADISNTAVKVQAEDYIITCHVDGSDVTVDLNSKQKTGPQERTMELLDRTSWNAPNYRLMDIYTGEQLDYFSVYFLGVAWAIYNGKIETVRPYCGEVTSVLQATGAFYLLSE